MSDKEYGNHVVQYPPQYSVCTGCSSCQVLCGFSKDGVVGPGHGAIRLEYGELDHMYHTVLACQHCVDHPCYDKCPKPGKAMIIDENNIVYIDEDECIGCGLCAKACKFTPSRITMDKNGKKAKKCDLCRTRPDGPICVANCPAFVLGLSDDPLPYKTNEKGEWTE